MQNGYNAVRDITPGAPEEISPDVSFMDTAQASLSYKYGPIADAWNQARKYPIAPIDGFSARDNIPEEYLDWSSTLVSAVNQEHLDLKISQIDDRIELHKTLQNSGIIPMFAVELFDPVNWMGVPFMKAGSISKSFLRSGTGVTSIVGMQEAIRYPFDPLATPAEVGMNLSMSFVMGGVLGGAVSIPQQRRLKAAADAKPELEAWYKAIQKKDSYTELQGKIKEQEVTLGSTKEKLEELKASELGGDLNNPEGRYLLKKIDIAERSLKVFNRQLELAEGDASIAANIFTDSWIFKSVTTPMKRVLQNPNIPDSVKVKTLMIANDSGILLAMNRNGKKIGSSVWQNAKQFDGEWVMLQDDLQDLWGQSTGNGTVSALDYTYNRSGFESWLEGIDKKAIRGEAPANDIEAQVMNKINNFYEVWETRLSDTGEIGSKPALERVIALREVRIEKVKKNLEASISANHRRKLEGQLKRNLAEIQEAKASLDAIAEDSASKVLPPNESIFRPRYYDIPAILKNREQFEQILVDWFKQNPIIVRQDGAKFLRNRLPTDEASLRARAKDTTDQILGLKDLTDPDVAFYGLGKSKHLRHRTLDIPNKLVLDFIQTNPRAVMQAYTQRTARRYEFSRQFNGLNIKDVLDDVYDDMKASGSSSEEAWAAMKEMRHLHEAVVGGMYRDPDAWSHKTANVIRKLAQYNYLGQAYKSTITEPAKILMEHGIGPTMKGLFGILRDNKLKMGAKEARFGGEAVDNIMNSISLRMVDDQNNNPFSGDLLDKAAHPFFLLNGLGPITKIMKDLDAMLRSHSLVDYSIRWTQGKATKMEQEYLLRYNIDLKIATEIANAPWERSSDGLYMANTEAWTNTIQFPATTAKVISGNTNTYYPVKAEPKPSIDSKVSKLKERADEILDEEISIAETRDEVRDIERGFEENLLEAKALRGTTITSLNKNVDELKQVSKESQDFYESMQSGFEPDDKALKNILEKERKLTETAVNLKQELEALDESIKNLEAATVASDRLKGIEDSVSKDANRAEELSNERVAIESEVRIREFLQENKIDYDDLSDGLKERASNLAEEDYSLNNSMDDGGDYFASNVKAEEKALKKKVSDFKADAKAEIDALPKPKGRYGPAFYNAKSNTIRIDEEYIKDVMYDLRGWENPRVEGVTPIKEGIINSPDDYVAFIKMHEVMHSLNSAKSLGFDRRTKQGLADYENAINDLAVAEIEKQPRISPETVREFRSALSSGVLNTILMGTPADLPAISKGVVYIPMRVASQFGMKEDPKYTGYARIENGLLGLPFQFYSYSLAAMNKITAAHAHGQMKNQFIGIAASMGLGYMALQLKTPDWVEMDFEDQFARSFDYSGQAALLSDMMYTAMSTSLALGGPNLTGGLLEPRFPQEPNAIDAVTGLAGAGASTVADITRGVADILSGNVGEGAAEIVDDLPFTGLFFIDGLTKSFQRMLRDMDEDQNTGYRRY
tara:strand:- start:111 stop:4523 length:4413 start_codon:yes stop_codon:yes gene_type:complete